MPLISRETDSLVFIEKAISHHADISTLAFLFVSMYPEISSQSNILRIWQRLKISFVRTVYIA